MAWRIPTDTKIAASVAARIDAERTGVGIARGAVDGDRRRGAVA
ncbi:hypothetical protein [Paracraurococcus lichenis]|uniref:Uncharacterized protein n=1 Tax=Paracraurococcus lichenis TaxID=3064888 RepID=A0ABT9ECE6_9PROT|nr:hypothetical protein [Paracraurococcus sp. LOR1-02]MDO9713893.1 hypothetical protein [Paracraurococcus sp. LOR1-02]